MQKKTGSTSDRNAAISMTLALLLAFLPMLALPAPACCEPIIRIFVDDRELACDVPPQSDNGRILVPLRSLGETLGFDVTWDEPSQSAILEKDQTLVSLTAGSVWASVNGVPVEIDTPMQVVNSRVLAPLRFIGENFGCTAEWHGENSQVRIYTNPSLVAAAVEYVTYCSLNDQATPYQVDYPLDFIKASPGMRSISFTSPDNLAVITITEAPAGDWQNISQCFADEYKDHKDSTIYQHLKSDEKWYVLAWSEGGKTVYSKTFYCDDAVVTGQFSFPAGQEKSYHGMIERFLQSFQVNPNQE